MIDLQIARSAGVTTSAWSKTRRIPKRTAYRWAALPGSKTAISGHRTALADAVISRLADVMAGRIARDLTLTPT